MPLKCSWLLVLILLSLALNVPNLIASGNVSPEPKNSNSASPPTGEKEKENKSDSHTQEAQRSPSPPAEPIKAISEPATEAKKESPKTETQNTVPGGRQEGLTWGSVSDWALVIVAIITAYVALKSLGVIQIQTKAAQDTAAAALEESRAITLSERAYVFAKVVIDRRFSDREGKTVWEIVTLFINHGKTPAIIINMAAIPSISETAPQTLLPIAHEERHLPEGWVIAKDGEFGLPSRITIPDKKSVEDGSLNVYCSGFICYKDILGKERRTGYCWEYVHRIRNFNFCKTSDLNKYD